MNVQVYSKQRISLCKCRPESDPGLMKMFVWMFADIQSVDLGFFHKKQDPPRKNVCEYYWITCTQQLDRIQMQQGTQRLKFQFSLRHANISCAYAAHSLPDAGPHASSCASDLSNTVKN